MLVYFLYLLFFVSCLVLITTVLLQPGKTDAGALFTSNISSTAFGPRGTQSVLSRITIGAAIVFMLSALLLAMPAVTGNVSVLNSTNGAATETAAPLTPAAPTTETNANTAIVVPSGANANAPGGATINTSATNNK